MKLNRFFLLTLGFFVLFLVFFTHGKKGFANPLPEWKQEIQSIDRQIEELKEMKRGYEARALRHENQAERLQFMQGELSTAKKHWQLAEENRAIAKKIQMDIDQLQERKEELLKQHSGKQSL